MALIRGKCGCLCSPRSDAVQSGKVGRLGALCRQPIGSWDRNEPEAIVILPLVVAPAAFETGDVAFHGVDAGESGAAFAAGIEEAAFETDALERQIMASRFVRDAEILAGSPPFSSMRCNLAAPDAMLR